MEKYTEEKSLLNDVNNQVPGSPERLVSYVYNRLRKMARAKFGPDLGGTLASAPLVHEFFMEFVARANNPNETDEQGHPKKKLYFKTLGAFFGYTCRVMRHIILGNIRAKNAAKRGKGQAHLSWDSKKAVQEKDMLGIFESYHEIMESLKNLDPQAQTILDLKYSEGFTHLEIGESLNITEKAVEYQVSKWMPWLKKHFLQRGIKPPKGKKLSSKN